VFGGPLTQCDGWRRRILTPPPDRQDRIEAVAVRMATLVDLVVGDVSRPVVDETGFEQPFNFVLEFTPNVAVSDYGGPSTLPNAGPSAAPVPNLDRSAGTARHPVAINRGSSGNDRHRQHRATI